MAKKIEKQLKLQIPGGKADPSPPIGPALGAAGINIGEFVNQFNQETADMQGDIVPVVITVYDDRTFEFQVKTPPASKLLLKAAGKEKGSGKNLVSKAGSVTEQQVREIAEQKMPDLNATDVEAASQSVKGTAKSMGIKVEG